MNMWLNFQPNRSIFRFSALKGYVENMGKWDTNFCGNGLNEICANTIKSHAIFGKMD
jgi:hypothetical protein